MGTAAGHPAKTDHFLRRTRAAPLGRRRIPAASRRRDWKRRNRKLRRRGQLGTVWHRRNTAGRLSRKSRAWSITLLTKQRCRARRGQMPPLPARPSYRSRS